MPGRSAVLVPLELPAGLQAVRERADRMAARGVPPHVTILFPFLPVDALTPDVRVGLERLAAGRQPSVTGFDRVQRMPGMVWLLPADPRPFLRLTSEVWASWPDHPPYGGAHAELVPHLTLVETPDPASLDLAAAEAVREGPFEVATTELLVIAEDMSGDWHTHWRLPLGGHARSP